MQLDTMTQPNRMHQDLPPAGGRWKSCPFKQPAVLLSDENAEAESQVVKFSSATRRVTRSLTHSTSVLGIDVSPAHSTASVAAPA